ncbi:MAG: hypothetical protein M0D57_10825 [Sphingobacteriales bacterium JAD_PAG50586_3]|nr:MAG: hypothetical protein M0D57_10825 [Sphingobacteriales bacterium JAD_PAG50586_3]
MKENTYNNEGNSTLLDTLPKLNCFRVPDGYFNRLHQAIELRVQLKGLPFDDVLSALKKAQPYALPANYFDSLADKIAAKTQPQQLPQETGFAVPEGYFETLYLNVVERVAQENAPARVWWQNAGVVLRPAFAVAAVVAVAVFIALPYLNNNPSPPAVVANNTPVTNDNKSNTPNNTTVKTVATPDVKTVAETAKNTTTKRVVSKINTNTNVAAEAAALFDYTDDFNAEGLLSEAPERTSNDDNSLVELVAEENLDLAELIDGM